MDKEERHFGYRINGVLQQPRCRGKGIHESVRGRELAGTEELGVRIEFGRGQLCTVSFMEAVVPFHAI